MVQVLGESIGQAWPSSIAYAYHLESKVFSLRLSPVKSTYSGETVIPPKENAVLLAGKDAEWPQNSNDPLRELGSSSYTSDTEVCTLCFPRLAWYQQWSQPVVILSHYSQGHLAISKDIFGC